MTWCQKANKVIENLVKGKKWGEMYLFPSPPAPNKKEGTLLDQERRWIDKNSSSEDIELRQFAWEIIRGDLPHNLGISESHCEQWLRKRRKGRMLEVESGWLKVND